MGTCRSSCSHSTDLEYYDAWRKDPPMRASQRRPIVVMDRRRKQRATRRQTKLWVCDRGCCSIRWKLDYAEFQSYLKYAVISPYVVEQTNHEGCVCVICKGLSDQFLQCGIDQLPTRLRKATATPSETDDEEDDCEGGLHPEEDQRDDHALRIPRSPVASPVA